MWRPWVRREMLNYALHTLIKMISKIDYREMSSKIINVSKNVNNYNSETWNAKNALKKIIFIRNITTISISSIPLLYLSWKLQELRKCHVLSNYYQGELWKTHDFSFLFFFCLALQMSDQGKGKMTENVLYVLNSLWDFGTLHQKIYVLYLLCESFLPYQTHDCPAIPSYLMNCAIFYIYLSITASLLMFPASLPSAIIDSISRKGKVIFCLKKCF